MLMSNERVQLATEEFVPVEKYILGHSALDFQRIYTAYSNQISIALDPDGTHRIPLSEDRFARHFFNPNVKDKYMYGSDRLGYIMGSFVGNIFFPTHFAPSDSKSAIKLIKDLSKSHFPTVLFVTPDIASMLERIDGWKVFTHTFQSSFRGNEVEKQVAISRPFDLIRCALKLGISLSPLKLMTGDISNEDIQKISGSLSDRVAESESTKWFNIHPYEREHAYFNPTLNNVEVPEIAHSFLSSLSRDSYSMTYIPRGISNVDEDDEAFPSRKATEEWRDKVRPSRIYKITLPGEFNSFLPGTPQNNNSLDGLNSNEGYKGGAVRALIEMIKGDSDKVKPRDHDMVFYNQEEEEISAERKYEIGMRVIPEDTDERNLPESINSIISFMLRTDFTINQAFILWNETKSAFDLYISDKAIEAYVDKSIVPTKVYSGWGDENVPAMPDILAVKAVRMLVEWEDQGKQPKCLIGKIVKGSPLETETNPTPTRVNHFHVALHLSKLAQVNPILIPRFLNLLDNYGYLEDILDLEQEDIDVHNLTRGSLKKLADLLNQGIWGDFRYSDEFNELTREDQDMWNQLVTSDSPVYETIYEGWESLGIARKLFAKLARRSGVRYPGKFKKRSY